MKLKKTFVRPGGGQSLLNKILRPSSLLIVATLLVLGLSIGYSSITKNLNITGVITKVRLKSDIRITNITLNNAENNGESTYQDYNKENISMGVYLPEENSQVTYKVEVTNIGNVETGILSIDNLPSNLDYTLADYTLKEKICDTDNQCKLGIKKEFYITIKYKSGGYIQ